MRTWHISPIGFTRWISPRVITRVVLVGLIGAALWLLVELPAFVEFGLAVAAASAWCVFLDTRPDVRPEPTPDGGTRMSAQVNRLAPVVGISKQPVRSYEEGKAA